MEIICPINLSDQHKTLLGALFKQTDGEITVFQPGTLYTITQPKPKGQGVDEVSIILTHTIYKRPREHHPKQFRYDIIDEDHENAFDQGGTSIIYKVLGTLKPSPNGTRLSTHKRRLAKVALHEAHNPTGVQNSMNGIFNEMQLANLAGSGHMKQAAWLSYDDQPYLKSYLTMRQRKGETLFNFINAERGRSEAHTLNTQERLDLTLSTLGALQDLHKKGVIHRDIKLENMFYQRNKNKITFIDFGFSKIKSMMDNDGKGTHGYIPPEFYLGEQADEKSDLYSLGITLSLIWGGHDQSYDMQGRLLDSRVFNEPDFRSLLRYVTTDFLDIEKTMFKDWMTQITAIDRNERLTVKAAIDALETFKKHYKKSHEAKREPKSWFDFFKKRTPSNDPVMESKTSVKEALKA